MKLLYSYGEINKNEEFTINKFNSYLDLDNQKSGIAIVLIDAFVTAIVEIDKDSTTDSIIKLAKEKMKSLSKATVYEPYMMDDGYAMMGTECGICSITKERIPVVLTEITYEICDELREKCRVAADKNEVLAIAVADSVCVEIV